MCFKETSFCNNRLDPVEQAKQDWKECAKNLNSTFKQEGAAAGKESIENQLGSIFGTDQELSSFVSAQGENDNSDFDDEIAKLAAADPLINLESPSSPSSFNLVRIKLLVLSLLKYLISCVCFRAASLPPRQWNQKRMKKIIR